MIMRRPQTPTLFAFFAFCAFSAFFASFAPFARAQATKPRARDLGIAPGVHAAGALDAITDVGGVRVGHTTILDGDRVRTGVTAIVPHGGNVFQDKVAGAVFVGNAFGKLAGSTQVAELGTIETPIVLTNTLSVGTAVDAVARYTIAQPGNEEVRSVNPLVGETNDGGLNDIRGFHVTREHVLDAIRGAKTGPVAEGAVGAGTGTICYGWKGGIGTASRKLQRTGYTVGVLAQTNFGGNLTIAGVPIYKSLQPRVRVQLRARQSTARQGRRAATARACSSSRPTRRSTRAICAASPRAPSSASAAPDPRTATAAATSRSPSRPRPRCAAASTRPRRARAACCRPTPPRRCSKRRSKRRRRRCTTRSSRRRRSAPRSAPPKRSRSIASAICSKIVELDCHLYAPLTLVS
jgi:L-aminopeptidase/D-esterase-like protein